MRGCVWGWGRKGWSVNVKARGVWKEYLPPTDCDVIFPIPKVIKQNPSPLAT